MLTLDYLTVELRDRTKRVMVATGSGSDSLVRVEMKLVQQTLADIERALIEEVLRFTDYNKSLAAKHLGLTRFALDRRLKKMGGD